MEETDSFLDTKWGGQGRTTAVRNGYKLEAYILDYGQDEHSFTQECAKTVAGNICTSPVLGQFQAMLISQHNSQQHQGFLEPQKAITAARDNCIIEKG